MTHFLLERERRTFYLSRPLAAVVVRSARRGKDRVLIVQTPDEVERAIGVLRVGTVLAPLPPAVRVIGSEGVVSPSHGFWVTIDPFHMLIDAEDPC